MRAGPVRLRLPAVLASVVALGAGVAGCGGATNGTNNQGVTIAGSTLTIYVSQPPGDTGGQAAVDVVDAERLAFDASGERAGAYHLGIVVAHDREVSADARAAVSDKTAIAYLGEVTPGASGVSVQITNELGLLQVSPTDTAAYLTQATPNVKDSPGHFYPSHSSFGSTFARLAPSTAVEARAIAARAKSDGVSSLYVSDDGSDYGASIAAEVRSAAAAAGLTLATGASGAGGAFYGGTPGPTALRALNSDAVAAPRAKLFAPSALYDDTFVAQLSAGAQKALTVSVPGFPFGQTPAAGGQFAASFEHAYGHAPAPQAIFGYEAMRAVIATLREAGDHASSRSTVVHDFRDLRRPANDSAIGAYAISDGGTGLTSFVFARVAGGRLVPSAAH